MAMKLQQETVTLRGLTFTVTELAVRDMMPLVAASEGELNNQVQDAVFRAAVTLDGKPIEDIQGMPAGIYMKLLPVVMRLNALGDETDAEGN